MKANKNLEITDAQIIELEKLDINNIDNVVLPESLKELLQEKYEEVDEQATLIKIQTQLDNAGFSGTIEDYKRKKLEKEFRGGRFSERRNLRRGTVTEEKIEEIPEIDDSPIIVKKTEVNELKLKDAIIGLLFKKIKKFEKRISKLEKP